VKERPILFSAPMVRAILDGRKTQTRRVVKPQPQVTTPTDASWHDAKRDMWRNLSQFARDCCPYGVVGDRLAVRETWQEVGDAFYYRATDEQRHASILGEWKPSIHMPRKACRITLEITGVRVERLNEISVVDCHAEGIAPTWEGEFETEAFERLWDSINGKKHPWSSNPWVWVLEFKRIGGAP